MIPSEIMSKKIGTYPHGLQIQEFQQLDKVERHHKIEIKSPIFSFL